MSARDLDRVQALARELWGEAPQRAGTLHVMAVAREGSALRVIRIGEASPKSARDFFSLEYARARADAIVLSGSVVRDEPTLVYDLWEPALHALRGEREPPLLVILTQSGELPAEHPIWQSWARPLVYTGLDVALTLPPRVEIVRHHAPTPRTVLDYLRKERGARTLSLEAGPSVVKPLYDPPCRIDELTLSIFEGALDPDARGGRFLDEDQLHERMELVHESVFVEESGPWRFRRYLSRLRSIHAVFS